MTLIKYEYQGYPVYVNPDNIFSISVSGRNKKNTIFTSTSGAYVEVECHLDAAIDVLVRELSND